MVHGGRRGCLRARRILFLDRAAQIAESYTAARAENLPEPLLGTGERSLLPDGGIRQQGRAAPCDEFAVLDADLLRDAGGHRGGPLLPPARAAGFALRCLRHPCAERLPFLPAV